MNTNKPKEISKDKDEPIVLVTLDRRNAKVLLSYLEHITMGDLALEQVETASVLHKLMRSLRYDLRPDK